MRVAVAIALAMVAAPAAAQDRDLCADRPGLGSPPCVVSPGRVLVETGVVDWTREDTADERTDTLLIGDTLVRIGLIDTIEAQLGWTPFGHERTRERSTGALDRVARVGDALVGLKWNLARPDGSGFSAAFQSQASLPIGRAPIGAGDWGASFIVPLSYELPGGLSLQASPEIDAAVDEDGHGRHLAWGATVGLGVDIGDAVGAALEVQAIRDDDPMQHRTRALVGLSAFWQPGKDWQLDAGVNAGLNQHSEDVQLYAGVSRRF